jgi:outer membrane protein assembly factor BamD
MILGVSEMDLSSSIKRFPSSAGWRPVFVAVILAALVLAPSCARRRKYENPITKDTLQPDKVLFDKAVRDIERSRFEVARLTLNTLVNTYDTSEYLAKAKLAIADSWFREGGSHGLAQAEAEYKDFILFYPTMEEASEAQYKICGIHYKQMEKSDRDPVHALRAEDECRQVLTQFPNTKHAPKAEQMLRQVQEVIADHEYVAGAYYHHKGSFPAAANRLQTLTDQYPLYSGADEALWKLGDSYGRMGDRFENQSAAAYTRIVKDYPLSSRVEDARKKLEALGRAIPEADAAAVARMQYEIDNRTKAGKLSAVAGIFRKSPDVRLAAKAGTPPTTSLRPGIPASVPPVAAGTVGTSAGAVANDVTVSTVTDSTQLDNSPDARRNPPAETAPGAAAPAAGPANTVDAAAGQAPLPTNRQPVKQKKQKEKKKKK